MTLPSLVGQLLNGLASASMLFLVAAGLSLIFGVSRIVNFAHGSLYMLGAYVAWTATDRLSPTLGGSSFWAALLVSGLGVALLGGLVEVLILRRIYRAPELLQLLATFAVALVVRDLTLKLWGPEDLLGPRVAGLTKSIAILGRPFPQYDALLILIGPLVLLALQLLLRYTRFGTLIRAATEDREMISALGVNGSLLFTAVFVLGAFLAGAAGALQLPREPASLDLDLRAISDAFVVVVVGGLGSLPGAYLAALLIGLVKAACIAAGQVDILGITVSFPALTLVAEFIVMAVVLVARPWGLLGKPQASLRVPGEAELPLQPADRITRAAGWMLAAALVLLPWVARDHSYTSVLMVDILCFALFAASLHFIMGPGGMHSFGHAAYFGLGAYGAGVVLRAMNIPMEAAFWGGPLLAAAGALLFGWFCVRLSGIYLAMLTLAFGQIVWSVAFQWDAVTGGSNGLTGVWPAAWLNARIAGLTPNAAYYYVTLAFTVMGVLTLWRLLHAPFGYAMRAGRDSRLRAEAIGIDVRRHHWYGFAVAGGFAGIAGALYAFSKGSISPDMIHVGRSVDGIVMVLLGGIQTLAGPLVGAAVFTTLQDSAARTFEYWRAGLGAIVLLLVLAFPQGIAGFFRARGATRVQSPKQVASA
jgi:branched-chain amino acid transport system permease protein